MFRRHGDRAPCICLSLHYYGNALIYQYLTVIVQNPWLTWFQRLDSNGGGVVPETLPHLTKLPVSQFADELQGTAFDLPLVSCTVRQAAGHGLLNLHTQCHATAGRPTQFEMVNKGSESHTATLTGKTTKVYTCYTLFGMSTECM
jgi:hypothetical protein